MDSLLSDENMQVAGEKLAMGDKPDLTPVT
jgi:hypothetical protein